MAICWQAAAMTRQSGCGKLEVSHWSLLSIICNVVLSGKDVKVEMRDHDHVVECVAWAPEAATQAINEAARDAAGGDNKNR